ncbi:MAG: hypothetical protein KF722_15740 [Nitrospira sp.]|nr:hypothetical protein [Nitrospira sp.]
MRRSPKKGRRFRFPYNLCSVSRSTDHLATELCAPTALLRTWTAQGMLRRMTFAYRGALVANLSAEPAESLGPLRVAADPFGGEKTNVRAIEAKSDATCHQIIMVMMLHADHIVRARLADLRA